MADSHRFDTHVADQRFQLLINSVTDYAIYMLDPEGRIATWNPGARLFKGYEADEVIGRHFSTFFTPEDRAAGIPERALATAAAEGKFETEGWRVRKDGTRFWAHVVVDPVRDDQGQLIGFAKITRDVSDRRRAQEELEEARAALFQAQKLQALGELTGGIAHDFNNLMTVIRGSADLLRREDLPPEKRRRYLEAIIETADRAATLTDHLLAFSRRQALKPEVTDLNVRLDAFGEVLGRTLGAGIEVRLDLEPQLWRVEVDPTQLESALLNAAFNSRDAMPGGGTITLSTRNLASHGTEEVCVAITDTGEGMTEEVVSRAFEPFFTTKPIGKGTGLGLSQIHGFAAQSGGRAEIHSKSGEGTSIRLILPRTEKARAEEVESSDAGRSAGGQHILLVEDNDHVREFAENLLEDLGYRVSSAASGEAALERLAQGGVDLVFSDVVMPGLSGLELARAARQIRPDMPVLLASGYSEAIVGGGGAEFDFVRKPYDPRRLEAALRRAFDRAAALIGA